MINAILRGKPDAGNPHVRFDEGEVASAKPRRGSLLYKDAGLHEMAEAVIGVIAAIMAFTCLSETPDYSQWVQMVTSDSTNATGIVSTGRPKCSWTQGSYWADDTAPNSNKSYFVPAGFTIFGPESSWSDNWTFPGKALAVVGQRITNRIIRRCFAFGRMTYGNKAAEEAFFYSTFKNRHFETESVIPDRFAFSAFDR